MAEALWADRRLAMRYESWTQVTEREVDPLGLVLKAGAWYLVARQGREVRTFRVAAIQRAEARDAVFQRPRQFDLAAHWREATQRFEEGIYRDIATLRVSPTGLRRLRNFSPIVAQAADRSLGEPDHVGWRTVSVPIEAVDHAAREMLRLGAEAEVLEPAALRERLRASAERLAALYAAP